MTFRVFIVVISLLAYGVAADAQGQRQGQGAERSIPLRVELVISRYQADKKVSSLPYSFVVNATDPGHLEEFSRVRMGVEIPVVGYPPTPDAKQNAATGQTPAVQYRPFGTNIDCFARILDDGRFKVGVTVEESSPLNEQEKARSTGSATENRAVNSTPVFRSFRISNTLVLKDGQSQQFSTATDRFSGEIVKIDMTLSVIK
jgi:hypothetical protein